MPAPTTDAEAARRPVKILYLPVGRLCGYLTGVIAGVLFKRAWRRIKHDDHEKPPTALQSEYRLGEVLVAAMLQGAITGGVGALITRGGARAFQHWTGEWPGQ